MPLSDKMTEEINKLNLPLWLPENSDIFMKNLNQNYVLSIR